MKMNKETKSKIDESKKLMIHLKKCMKLLNMEDWNIRIAYEPKPDNDSIMEVDQSVVEYKNGKITVYKIDSNVKKLEEDFIHELFHLKTGMIKQHYEKIIDSQNELLKDLVNLHEERLMEDLTKVVIKCLEKKA